MRTFSIIVAICVAMAETKTIIPTGVYMGEAITSSGGIVGGRLVISDNKTLSFSYVADGSVFGKSEQIQINCEGVSYTSNDLPDHLVEIRVEGGDLGCIQALIDLLSVANMSTPPLSFFYDVGDNAIETGFAFRDSLTMHLFA